VGIWVILCVQKPSLHFLQNFRPQSLFKVVIGDNSLYPKQLSLFCLLRLISARTDRNDYIANLCIMIELLHELKNSIFEPRSTQAFHNVSAGKKDN